MLKELIFLSIVILILRYNVVNTANPVNENSGPSEECTSTCSSKECIEKAKTLIANMDPNVNPCDGFYQFVCGNYIKQQLIPEDKVSINELYAAQDKLDGKLIDEMKGDILATDLEYVKKLKIHYKNCLDEAEIEKVDTEPLMDLLKRLGGWPVLMGDAWNEEDYTWEKLISSISEEGFHPSLPIYVFVHLDSSNSHHFSLHVVPTSTAINDISDDKFIEAYESYLIEFAVLLGASRDRAEKDMKDVVNFDQKLFKAQLPRDELDDVSRLENRRRISDLDKEYSGLPWLDIINGILSPSNVSVTENEYVEIHDPKFMSEIGPLMKNTPKRVLANYQILGIIRYLVTSLSNKFLNLRLNFLQNTTGLQKLPKREKFCLGKVRDPFYVALSSFYVKKYVDVQSRDSVNYLIQAIRRIFEAYLKKINWMDDYTRSGALKKFRAMKTLVGFSDELFDNKKIGRIYENLEITPGKFFADSQKIAAYAKNFNFQKLNKPVEQYKWISDANVAIVNAFYDYGKNELSILAGILQDPLFNSQLPDYVNYGGIGYVIGHEITHGFDYTGRKYDYDGNIKDWWNNQTAEQFERKVQCEIDQYSNYTVKQIDKKINGKLTKGENIADAGGIKLAYRAYNQLIKYKARHRKPLDDCLPNLNYTPKQMFWISAATVWCEKTTDEALKTAMVKNSHSPFEARINVVFSNTEEFSKDFKCPAGSAMNPTKKCDVW